MPHQLINFEIKGDQRGSLIAIEESQEVPFDIKRVYYIFDTKPDVIRGQHAHLKLQQVLICVSGSCQVQVEENGRKQIYELNRADQGLYIGGCVWREMSDFSPGAVLMVLASDYYTEDDYLRDYQDFVKADQHD